MSAFDPERILRALAARDVRYVLVGATAARLQGFPRLTADADITPARDSENLLRSKEASGRPQDQQDVIVLREMLSRSGP